MFKFLRILNTAILMSHQSFLKTSGGSLLTLRSSSDFAVSGNSPTPCQVLRCSEVIYFYEVTSDTVFAWDTLLDSCETIKDQLALHLLQQSPFLVWGKAQKCSGAVFLALCSGVILIELKEP